RINTPTSKNDEVGPAGSTSDGREPVHSLGSTLTSAGLHSGSFVEPKGQSAFSWSDGSQAFCCRQLRRCGLSGLRQLSTSEHLDWQLRFSQRYLFCCAPRTSPTLPALVLRRG